MEENNTSFLNLLNKASKSLADFLFDILPKIDEDEWWDYLVLNSLPEIAKRNLNSKSTIYDIDIASLLKVFDANWHSISEIGGLGFIVRNYVKEMQTIRNQWAHQTSEGISNELLERHISTLYLLCKEIGADEGFLNEINDYKISLTPSNINQVVDNNSNQIKNSDLDKEIKSDSVFSLGTLIQLKSNHSIKGTINDISTTGEEPRYKVFANGKFQQYYHSQIELVESTTDYLNVSLEEFKACLTATQINNPDTSMLYSLNSAKIDLIPHQFRPVLKFIKSDRPRLLIADGVGVGKTIEAGLILKELEARNSVKSVLIICPKPLVTERKWKDEMKIRFGEEFEALDGNSFKEKIHEAYLDEWGENDKLIIPYSLFTEDKLYGTKKSKGLFNLDPPPKFDLVIVDEAHHIRNSNTWAYEAVKYFVDNASSAVFLTATPIQMGNEDLYTLLNLLRPDLIPNRDVFEMMSEPNQYINEAISEIRKQDNDWAVKSKRSLELANKTKWGEILYSENPVFKSVIKLLEKEALNDEERIKLLTDTESLHTFSQVLNRTRRRDIGEYAVRKTITIPVDFTKEQREIYDLILDTQAEILSRINPETPVGFMMSTLQRRASSCLPGLIPFLKDILTCNITDYDFCESEYYGDSKVIDTADIHDNIDNILKLASKLPKDDPKYDELKNVLVEAGDKVMIFSTYKHTLGYLAEKLSNDGYRVGVINGDVKDEDRRWIRDRFKQSKDNEDSLDILLFSEVGCEGLDYQFCNCMINYDLPWNPMKIEQRIGRIDRTGQKSEYVSIFNMITNDTVDADIYDRCLLRIGVFEQSIGGSEEILGEIAKEIRDIGDNFRLTDSERGDRIKQLSDNTIRKYVEQERLEGEKAELFGLSLPKMQMQKEIDDATSIFLSPESLENLVNIYLKKRLNSDSDFIFSDKSSKRIRLKSEYRHAILDDFRKLPDKNEYRGWRKWLEGKDKEHSINYLVSFDSEDAIDDDSDLITPVHPLIRQAISYLNYEKYVTVSFSVNDSDIPCGKYPFAIYLWNYSGVQNNLKLIPISENKFISNKLFNLLKTAVCESESASIDADVVEMLDSVHYHLWNEERSEHQNKFSEEVKYKKKSLEKSYNARLADIDGIIDSTTSEDIRRMKRQERENIVRDLRNRIDDLDKSLSLADVTSNPVAYGVVIVNEVI